jgi:hypothetical protein
MALMTFGAQKMRGKSTKRSIRDAMLIGSLGQLGGASMGVSLLEEQEGLRQLFKV